MTARVFTALWRVAVLATLLWGVALARRVTADVARMRSDVEDVQTQLSDVEEKLEGIEKAVKDTGDSVDLYGELATSGARR